MFVFIMPCAYGLAHVSRYFILYDGHHLLFGIPPPVVPLIIFSCTATLHLVPHLSL